MIEFLPGDPDNADIDKLPQLVSEITSVITDSESVADNADAEIVVPIAEDIKESEAVVSEAENLTLGEIGVAIDEAESLLEKVKGKVIDEAESLMTDAYTYMDLVGIPLPTPEEISYSEATKDYTPKALPDVTSQTCTEGLPQTFQVEPGQGCPPGYVLSVWFDGTHHCNKVCESGTGLPAPADTIDGGGGNDVPSCPPGYHFEPNATASSQTADSQTMGNIVKDGLEQPSTCEPAYTGGWDQYYNQTPYAQEGEYTFWRPWIDNTSNTANRPTDSTVIDGCHLRPPIGGKIRLYYPVTYRLYMRPDDGTIIAINHPHAGWVDITTADTPATGGPTGGIPGIGGSCVPDEPLHGSCRPPDELCGEESEWPNFPSDKLHEDVCKQIEEAANKYNDIALDFAKYIVINSGTGGQSEISNAIINAITGGHEPILSGLMRRFADWSQIVVKQTVNADACGSPSMAAVSVKQAIMKFIQKWTDIIPEQAMTAVEQISNFICQSILPSGEQADRAYLADTIDEKEWECWHKAAGDHLGPAKKVMLGKRTTPTPQQLDTLYRREKIDFESMRKGMREQGVIRDEDRLRIHDLGEHWPTATDVISWMKRDVFDDQNVDWGEADKDFEAKYTADAEKIGDGLGLTRKNAQRHWRAHYQYPSYTMGREFVARFNDPDLPENIRFDEAAFRNMLKIDDWHPAYVDRMVAAAYHPVTRSDAVKAYMIHGISDEELVKRIKATGYTEADARFYQEYYKKRRKINDRKASGYPTLRTTVNAYSRCEMSSSEFEKIVKAITIDDDQAEAAIESARLSRSVWERKQAIRTIKRPFVLGIYDEIWAQTELANADVDPGCVDELIKQWQRERLRRDKFLSASQLCQMYERGILTERMFVDALVRSGWGEMEAVLIVSNCGAMISEKLAKRARTESEKAARQLKQQLKDEAKAKRLAECGPPPCPANRQRSNPPSAVGP